MPLDDADRKTVAEMISQYVSQRDSELSNTQSVELKKLADNFNGSISQLNEKVSSILSKDTPTPRNRKGHTSDEAESAVDLLFEK